MPVTAADLKFFASTTLADTGDGGGARSATVLQSDVNEQIFPLVSASDRTTGRTRLRKFYPSLTNIDGAALLGASVAVNEVPDDPATVISMFAFGDSTTQRAAAVAALEGSSATNTLSAYTRYSANFTGPPTVAVATTLAVTWTGGGTTLTYTYNVASLGTPSSNFVRISARSAGTLMTVNFSGTAYPNTLAVDELGGDILTPGDGTRTITVTTALPGSGACTGTFNFLQVVSGGVPLYGTMAVPGITADAATVVVVSDTSAQVVPYSGGTYPTANFGIDPAPFASNLGKALVVRAGDLATLWHEGETSPATAVNAGTVTTGTTNLDQLAVVGADGVEIARFLAGGPTPPGGTCTADLAAGTATFVDVSGYSQPVSVRYRISHRTTVDSVSGSDVTIADATTRAFPAGSVLSTHLALGDMRARAFGQFGQQAWTNVFSDVLIGNSVGLQYTGTIVVTNQGAESDRWALRFTSATSFQTFSELRGLIGTGSTASNYAPVNPVTGAPYFTLSSAGWAPGILVGSVLRFNTEGASRPVWAVQCIKPTFLPYSGAVRTAIRLHGSV
jgi:hypothetical protein